MLKYQFPAVKGIQAGKVYYICMVPLGLLGRIYSSDKLKCSNPAKDSAVNPLAPENPLPRRKGRYLHRIRMQDGSPLPHRKDRRGDVAHPKDTSLQGTVDQHSSPVYLLIFLT